MKRILFLIAALMVSFVTYAQVNVGDRVSEVPTSGNRYYIVSDNGYFLTTKGSTLLASPTAPATAEWQFNQNADGSWRIRTSNSTYLSANGEGMSGGNIIIDGTGCDWTIDGSNAFRQGCYMVYTNLYLDIFGFNADEAISIQNEAGTIFVWPVDYGASNKDEDGYTSDFLFLTTVPDEWKGEGGGGGDSRVDEIIDVPVNDIEGDFQTNWKKSMQDAKVLTYLPMDNTQVYNQPWRPVRKGVTGYEYVIYREDVLKFFYGNKAKRLWFILPPNAEQIQFYIMDPMEKDPDKALLWSDYYDFSETVANIMSKPNGIVKGDGDGEPAYNLNVDVKDAGYNYYKFGTPVGIDIKDEDLYDNWDGKFSDKYPNLQIGFAIKYPGDYKENYLNGRDDKGGLADRYWAHNSILLPTSRSSYAFMMGDDDPDVHDNKVQDYTNYTEPMLEEFKWTPTAGLFCFVETEGEHGFPHVGLDFDDVKVSRCYTNDPKVPVSATFTNYGVDPILTAKFNVTTGENTSTLAFTDGIKFLERGSLNDDMLAPTQAKREIMRITVNKINGREVNLQTGIDGSIVAIDEKDDVTRMPVVEEATGTWCGWCPRGMVGMDMLRETYGEDVALIGCHIGADPKAYGFLDGVLGAYGATGAPSCVISRLYTGDPYFGSRQQSYFGIRNDMEYVRGLITEATVSIEKAEVSEDQKTIDIQASALFQLDSKECPYALTYVITEDKLDLGQQMSYYITQTSEADKQKYKQEAPELYELTQMPNPWKPTFNDVLIYCPEAWGIENSLQGAIHKGQKMTHNYTLTLPRTAKDKPYVTNIQNCRLIALLIDQESNEIVNAAQVKLGGDEAGVAGITIDQATAPVYDLSGRAVKSTGARGLFLQGGKKFVK